jgi:hypothetical protein
MNHAIYLVAVAIAMVWIVAVLVAAWRLHLWRRARGWVEDGFPTGRRQAFISFCVAGMLWGFAGNIALLPLIGVLAVGR